MNKLKQNLFTKKSWGGEVIWALTDGYMVKTIEIDIGNKTPFTIHEEREKSIIVVQGTMRLHYGECCGEEEIFIQELKEGWSWHIDPGTLYRYEALNKKAVRLIEVSSPQLDDAIILTDSGDIKSEKDIINE